MHRTRSLWMGTRTSRINALRGFCREFGLAVPQGARTGVEAISRALADPDSFAAKSSDAMARKGLEATPVFFWIRGPDNTRATQIAAGRAYARAQLAATALGLCFQPWSMTLQEFPEMAELYAATQTRLGATPAAPLQMLVRLGRAKFASPAPRRGLSEHIQA